MRELTAVVMAASAALGAWAARPLPLWPAVALALGALAWRRPLLLCVAVLLLTSALSARSWAGLQPPATGAWSGTATLAGDPADRFGALRVDLHIDGKRVEAWARGEAAGRLRTMLAGERAVLSGRLSKVPADDRVRLGRRHIAARFTVAKVTDWRAGSLPSRLTNGLRRTLVAGAATMPDGTRGLFAGFVLGDDREQTPEAVDDFRASGLSHLLVVSGQNVAFVLALLGPALRRLPLGGRLALGLVAVALFGTLTRWEPSVMRAGAMAATSMVAVAMGRPASSIRVLALAVTAALLVDPMLVGSVGFLLSVGACSGIALLSRPLAAVLPGPRPVADTLAVTLAAQVGVAPVLLPVFGSLPVASLPANLLATPLAGPLMMWGMSAGLVAGLAASAGRALGGSGLAALIHLPTRLAVGWIAGVATWAARAPFGQLTRGHALALVALAAVAVVAFRRKWPPATRAATVAAAIVVAVVLPVSVALRPPAADNRTLASGARLWRSGGATVVVLDGGPGPTWQPSTAQLFAGLRAAGVGRLDVLVVGRGGRAATRELDPVLARFRPRLLLAPPDSRLVGATVPEPGSRFVVGGIAVSVDSVDRRLSVTVTAGR